jgi:predicted O-methyltransferase YrrM
LLKRLKRGSFKLLERLGIHAVPNHYHWPIPDTRELAGEIWEQESEMIGVKMNETAQLELLKTVSAKFKTEYQRLPMNRTTNPFEFYLLNPAFDMVDAEMLYCIVRLQKPKRVVEIGSGFSTMLFSKALQANALEVPNYECELVAIDPAPKRIEGAQIPFLSEVIRKRVQQVPVGFFEELGDGDILFIDSSHILEIGSDVKYEYLEVVPRLKKGVVVHSHDIFLPNDYPKEWVLGNLLFWNEQYLLQAFLSFNNSFEVMWASSFMHSKHPNLLKEAFASYRDDGVPPGSLWMKKVR